MKERKKKDTSNHGNNSRLLDAGNVIEYGKRLDKRISEKRKANSLFSAYRERKCQWVIIITSGAECLPTSINTLDCWSSFLLCFLDDDLLVLVLLLLLASSAAAGQSLLWCLV